MKEIQVGDNCVLKIYATAQELPLDRYTKLQKYSLLEVGIGNTIESVANHFQKLHQFVANDMKEDALLEAENLHYNFYSILQEVNYSSMAFCCFIHSINGTKVDDMSEENLKVILKDLTEYGLAQGIIDKENESIKKKFSTI